jgi:hypothetical protein
MGRDDCPPVVAAHPPFWTRSQSAPPGHRRHEPRHAGHKSRGRSRPAPDGSRSWRAAPAAALGAPLAGEVRPVFRQLREAAVALPGAVTHQCLPLAIPRAVLPGVSLEVPSTDSAAFDSASPGGARALSVNPAGDAMVSPRVRGRQPFRPRFQRPPVTPAARGAEGEAPLAQATASSRRARRARARPRRRLPWRRRAMAASSPLDDQEAAHASCQAAQGSVKTNPCANTR